MGRYRDHRSTAPKMGGLAVGLMHWKVSYLYTKFRFSPIILVWRPLHLCFWYRPIVDRLICVLGLRVSMADHQRTSATSVHRSSPFPFVLGFALLTTMTCLYHARTLIARYVRAVSVSRHPRFGTCCHLISRTVMLVANSSSRALKACFHYGCAALR